MEISDVRDTHRGSKPGWSAESMRVKPTAVPGRLAQWGS